jgi:hypothetical protein
MTTAVIYRLNASTAKSGSAVTIIIQGSQQVKWEINSGKE